MPFITQYETKKWRSVYGVILGNMAVVRAFSKHVLKLSTLASWLRGLKNTQSCGGVISLG